MSEAYQHLALAAEYHPQYFGVGKHITDAQTAIRAALSREKGDKQNG